MATESVLLGLDVGTTNVKAVAYDFRGTTIATSSARLVYHRPRAGWAVYRPDDIWDVTAATLRQLSTALAGRYQPVAVAISSMAETAVPIDARGNAVYDAIAWFDTRTRETVKWWRERVGDEFIFARTGLPLQPIFGIHKLMWFKQHEQELFRRMCRWLNVADYVAYRLCGEQATDLSLASRMSALDLSSLSWSEEILAIAGIDRALLAPLVPSGVRLGTVKPDAAEQTGLSLQTAVVTGGHDHPCAALGAGVVRPGLLLDSMGTAEALLLVVEKPVLSEEVGRAGFQQGAHVVQGRYYCNGGLYTCGASIEWIRGILFSENDSGSDGAYTEIERLARGAPPGAGGVHFLPHLRFASPPHNDDRGRGAFIGMTVDTTRGDLARAVYEGLAHDARHSLAAMERMLATHAGEVRAVGGMTRNRLFMEIKAAMAERPYAIMNVDEAGCLGAAILAGLGAEVYSSVDDALSRMGLAKHEVSPDPRWEEAYAARFKKVYVKIYPALRQIHGTISKDFV